MEESSSTMTLCYLKWKHTYAVQCVTAIRMCSVCSHKYYQFSIAQCCSAFHREVWVAGYTQIVGMRLADKRKIGPCCVRDSPSEENPQSCNAKGRVSFENNIIIMLDWERYCVNLRSAASFNGHRSAVHGGDIELRLLARPHATCHRLHEFGDRSLRNACTNLAKAVCFKKNDRRSA